MVVGIVLDNQNELRWRDAPSVSGPHQTINNQWKRWSERGVFTRLMKRLVAGNAEPKNVMIDATYLKAHRTASSQRVDMGFLLPDRTQQRREHQAARRHRCGRPLSFFMTIGHVSDDIGAAALLDDLPKASWLLGNRGYDADRFGVALHAKRFPPCIPGRQSRNEPVK